MRESLRRKVSPGKPINNSEWDIGSIQDFCAGFIESLDKNATDYSPYLKGAFLGNVISALYYYGIFKVLEKEENGNDQKRNVRNNEHKEKRL